MPRRASVNNFGYGGANGHAILEGTTDLLPRSQLHSNTTSCGLTHVSDSCKGIDQKYPKVFMLSSKDAGVTKSMMSKLAEYIQQSQEQSNNGKASSNFDNLAHTLGTRRSLFGWRVAVTAATPLELVAALKDPLTKPAYSREAPRLGFVFNGQGAQWFGMGRELFDYPVFRQAMNEADKILRGFGAPWSLVEELMKDEATSQVHQVALSHPLCVSLQLCLVKLLASWNVRPNAVMSHSSGEAAAAFAAGALTFSDALGVAYYRGALADKFKDTLVGQGSMLAIGVGEKEVAPYIQSLGVGKAAISCINSPSSITVSGDDAAIDEVEQRCIKAGVFARKLKVTAAYHSDHMLPMADEYLQCLKSLLTPTKSKTSVIYGSPVTGSIIRDPSKLQASHWIRSLVQPVLFSPALQRVCSVSPADGGIHTLLELGPHGALAGPIRQTMKLPGLKDRDISYISCLTRGKDAMWTAQSLVAALVSKGYPVDLNAVNFAGGVLGLRVIHDLPSYPWNHNTKYWVESRLNESHRYRKHAPNRLIGTMIPGVNPLAPSWRHFLRSADLPWLRDHMVESDIVFPGAGAISMAIEALRQITDPSGESIARYKLRDIEFINALVIPDTTQGIEVQLSFGQCNAIELDNQSWWEYHLYSIPSSGEAWSYHSKGLISADLKSSMSEGWGDAIVRTMDQVQLVDAALPKGKIVDPESLFSRLRTSGIHHGSAFRNLLTITTEGDHATTTFKVQDPDARTRDAQSVSSHVIHPTTLDSVLQAAYCALKEDTYQNAMLLPRSISRLAVSSDISAYSQQPLAALSNAHRQDRRGFYSDVSVSSKGSTSHDPLVKMESLFCQLVDQPSSSAEQELDETKTCFQMKWHPDWTLMAASDIRKPLTFTPDPQEVAMSMELNQATFHYIHVALATLADSDVANLLPHHQKMFQWMQKIDDLVINGESFQGSSSWIGASEASKEILYDRVSQASVDGSLLCRIGHSLVEILRQRAAPLELMMEGGLLHKYYENTMRASRSYAQAKQLVEHFVHKTPHGRILEIGGGTGGCTTAILEALTSDSHDRAEFHFSHYDFTDISSGFFEKAAGKFAKWSGLISFTKLDIEVDPEAQSFEAGSYDLIIACQVLHATKSMQTTMTNVRKLLKPGGKLIMVETTRDTIDGQLIFGTLPGWWAGTEDGRTSSPSLSKQSWSTTLTTTGFSGLDVEVSDCEDDEYSSISTILSTAVGSPSQYPEEISIIWPEEDSAFISGGAQKWLASFRESLHKSTGIRTVVAKLKSFEPKGKFCVSFLEMFGPFLHRLDADSFHSLRRTLTDVKGVLWVSGGGIMNGIAPEYGMSQGFLRTLRMENRSQKLVSLDLEPKPESTANWSKENSAIIQKIIASSFDLDEDQGQIDCEFAVKESCVHVARIYEDLEENKAHSASMKAVQRHEMAEFVGSVMPLKAEVETVGLLDSLRFVEDEDMHAPLPDDYIEVEPKAFGVNFRDVLTALGHIDGSKLGWECSGVVTCVGNGITDSQFKIGDRICAVMLGNYGNRVRLHKTWVGHIPDNASFEQAASMPVIFITVYQSFVASARLEAGESVLIHAASGGVGQAAIMIAQQLKAEIFVTVGTEAKRDFIMQTYGIAEDHIFSSRDTSFGTGIMAATHGRGVDVILNSLAGNLLKESWNCIASFGRFIEIGKRDIQQNKCLEMAPLARAASFAAVDLDQDIRLRSHTVAKAMREVMRMWSQGHIKPPAAITQFAMSEMTNAFRLMQSGKHIGKVVCVPRAGDLVKVRTRTSILSIK
jgi:acyl transferase domain-containing protein/NADPH:quinone reductase-like Zn-dependent oxidoreductase